MNNPTPQLTIAINFWTLMGQPSPDQEWTTEERIIAVKEAGFDAYCCPANTPDLLPLLKKHDLRFCGAFDAGSVEQFAPRIRDILAVGNGPINCQLADHDTPVETAIQLTIALMEEAKKQNADVHLEMHRDTCTETPEKTYAIAEGFKKSTGHYPKINFDFSHPASVKHLHPSNYIDRLFENVGIFQMSTLWHMRPFNGHHCQVPVTDGKGNFSPEYQDMRPFIRQAFAHWLAGPRPNNQLWVMPELGPKLGYGLSCFPDSWQDAIVLGNDIKKIWAEALVDSSK
jgi:hypothetical protein